MVNGSCRLDQGAGDKKLYVIAAISVLTVYASGGLTRRDSVRLNSTRVDCPQQLQIYLISKSVSPVDPGRTATPSMRADGVAALSVASQTIARVHSVN